MTRRSLLRQFDMYVFSQPRFWENAVNGLGLAGDEMYITYGRTDGRECSGRLSIGADIYRYKRVLD